VGCGVDSPGSGWGPVESTGECGDEPSGFGTKELLNADSRLETFSFIFRLFNLKR
jgi:hypothetical protein